jgi:hypothetical protein
MNTGKALRDIKLSKLLGEEPTTKEGKRLDSYLINLSKLKIVQKDNAIQFNYEDGKLAFLIIDSVLYVSKDVKFTLHIVTLFPDPVLRFFFKNYLENKYSFKEIKL